MKQWLESEPDVVGQLRQGERLQLDALSCDDNPIFQNLLSHVRGCADCQRSFSA